MQRVAQDWLVLTLSHNDGRALGIATACQFGPYLLLSMQGGKLADRYSKRHLLMATQSTMGALALAMGLLDISGALRLWQVYALTLCVGVTTALDSPFRQSFFIELVGPDDLPNAISLNSATFNVGRIAGPLAAGAMIGQPHGTALVFLANAATFACTVSGLALMRTSEIKAATTGPRSGGQLRQAIRQVRSDRRLLVPIVLVSVTAMLGLNTLPILVGLMVRSTFHADAARFGFATTTLAAGSLAGTLIAARLARPSPRLLLGSAATFGGLLSLLAIMPSYPLFAAMLAPLGVATYLVITSANGCVQIAAPDGMRGRIMSIYLIAFFGPTPIGGVVIGLCSRAFGPQATLLGCGLVALLATLATVTIVHTATQHASVSGG